MPVNRAQWTHPDLQSLVQIFFTDPGELGEFTEIQAEKLPQPYRHLLAHTSHMTVTMESHHGCQVQVQVLDRHQTRTHYSRAIILRRETDQRVVQYGIARLNTSHLTGDVLQEIQSESVPLGRILIEHNVLRTVKLMTTWQISPGPALLAAFENEDVGACYGRTALIYTDGIPAVELLEIVANV